MNPANGNRARLSDIAEAAGIARLLADVTRRPGAAAPALENAPPARPDAPPPAATVDELIDDLPVGELFGRADQGGAPQPLAHGPFATPVAHPTPAAGHVPFGALTVAAFFGLVNWRNRPEDAKPRPVVPPDRPPGYEQTVGAVMAAFFGD
jgi:hypothetical protein